ncbi:MAG TPA: hypothetical protein V6C84_31025 [Coleofasciculaceae cyanobacterium]|jgi:hypothetical protein
MRLTDSAWEKLGEMAESRSITRADLLEEFVGQVSLDRQSSPEQPIQLGIFNSTPTESPIATEIITADTRKSGTELGYRLKTSSASFTNWIREGKSIAEKTKAKDPDGISWEREPGTKKYRPIFR